MKAVAVYPGQPESVHLIEIPVPGLDEIGGGRGVLVRVLRVGLDGTDKEINAAEYGSAPPGSSVLVVGHESLGRVEAVGESVTGLMPGDYVVASVRRPGSSIYDLIGYQDMTTDDVYFERGINFLHGYFCEYYVEDAAYLVRVPKVLSHVGVLGEPFSVAEKGIAQAFEIQRRLRVWRPRRAAVMGAGTLGLLMALALRLRGLDVVAYAIPRKPNRNAALAEAIGARYESAQEISVAGLTEKYGPFDLVYEATGSSAVAFDCMRAVAKNGVLVLASITGGNRKLEIAADKINLEFVLGNKVMVGCVNSAREDFESGIHDMAKAEIFYPGWLSQLLTHPVIGLENYRQAYDHLVNAKDAIKVYCEVA
jgi:threonine dehydrogenase-like Zn-dependent dehydrogenase